MQRVRKLAALLLLPLLLAGCTEQPPASTPPVDAETFLRELYGDRLVIEDGQYYYQWYAGEEFLNAEYDEDWLQPLQVDNQKRTVQGMIEDGSVTLDVQEVTVQPSKERLSRVGDFTMYTFLVKVQIDSDYEFCNEAEYLDIWIDGAWYTIFVPVVTARLAAFIPMPDEAEYPGMYRRLDDPPVETPVPDGHYRLTMRFSVRLENEDFGDYAVATEFDVQNGEVVRD